MKSLFIIPALAIIATSQLAIAQSNNCYSMGNDVNRGIDSEIYTVGQLQRSAQDIGSRAQSLNQIANQLRNGQNTIDLNSQLQGNLASAQQNVLRSSQGMYNVNVLLQEALARADVTGEVRNIINNAINNNLGPAQTAANQALSQLDGLKNQISALNDQLKNSNGNVNAANSIAQEASSLQSIGYADQNQENQLASSLGYTKSQVTNLASYCASHP